jgi:hypothetical protein
VALPQQAQGPLHSATYQRESTPNSRRTWLVSLRDSLSRAQPPDSSAHAGQLHLSDCRGYGDSTLHPLSCTKALPSISLLASVWHHSHMRYEEIKDLPDKDFQRLAGVRRETFLKMWTIVTQELRNLDRPPKLSRADQLLLWIPF